MCMRHRKRGREREREHARAHTHRTFPWWRKKTYQNESKLSTKLECFHCSMIKKFCPKKKRFFFVYSWVNVRFFFSFFQFQPLLSILLLFRHCHCLVCCFFLSLSFTFAFCAHHYCSNKKTYTNLFSLSLSLSRRRNNNIIKKEQKTSILHWQEKKRNLTNFPCTITCFFSLSPWHAIEFLIE